METNTHLLEECSSKILAHLDRNIIQHRSERHLAEKYACMKKYIYHTFVYSKKLVNEAV